MTFDPGLAHRFYTEPLAQMEMDLKSMMGFEMYLLDDTRKGEA